MSSAILQPGRNVWRIERAARAAVLVDGAAFFGALRRAFLNAQRSIFIVGWDIDSRTRLVGEDQDPDDGYSPVLGELLTELVTTRPGLHVYILLWDFSVVYATERELFPRLSLQWKTPGRVTLCMDDAVPFGSSQHQKLFLIDDALAFSGGLDLTQRRWDTHDHRPDDPDRVDVANRCYPPFHDVQMMVDGDAARALAVLARRRWCKAYGTEPPIEPCGDPWPQHVTPQFRNVGIGIARTQPAFGEQEQVREVEALYFDAVDMAERSIYIENQFMTSRPVAERLARRLRERPALEIVAVAPRAYKSWAVSRALGDERIRFQKILEAAGGNRARLVYPAVRDGRRVAETMVHSKVMIVDDRLLRVGSANLNNRSMGADTECDLAIEAHSSAERAAIADIRNRLLSDHCGVPAEAVATELARRGSLVAVADRLSGNGHRLRRIEDGEPDPSAVGDVLKGLIDPSRPLSGARVWHRVRRALPGGGAAIAIVLLALLILALTLAWSLTPVSDMVTREWVQGLLAAVAGSAWAPLWVLVTYLIAGAIAFPVVVLIIATAATFGPWLGFLYAALGVLASAIAMYAVGALLGRDVLKSIAGPRWNKVQRAIEDRGMLAVAAIRVVPIAPFTLVNMTAGACSIRLLDYVAGTVIGMLPGLVAISALGTQITSIITDFSIANFVLLLLFIAGWLMLAWSAQLLVGRLRKRAS
jgi:phosphatidylserine/phosphatidylglycerophosphate/cardiolipin synthase-like enzyme/uncharacterized membrane protein YdjX (TVP38/TMEM64 family)